MSYSVYRINLPESPEAVVFINGFVSRDKPGTACAKGDRAGFFWMWKQLLWIKNVTAKAKGCMQVKAGICGVNEVIMVSYWVCENSLKEFFRGEPHRQMMQFIAICWWIICLFSEPPRRSVSQRRERAIASSKIKNMTTTDVRLWTVDEYYRMAAAGIITPDERVELIEGQVIPMSPKNPPHAATNLCAADVLRKLLSGKALIRIQDPVRLSLYSEPEPDIAVVRIDSQFYRDRHPIPDDIFLLVEVADSTLNRDTQQKAQIYAKAKIADYWVLDVNSRQVYVFREPLDNRYTQQIILDENGTISLVAFAEVEVKVGELFA